MENVNAKRVPALSAIVAGRCPVCREGAVFQHSMFSTKGFLAVHPQCEVCGTNYEPEPGFFWGAMYFSYAFEVAIIVLVSLILYFGFGVKNEWVYVGATVVPIILAIPLVARLSRMLWLYWFGPFSYDPSRGLRGSKLSSGQA